MSAVTAQEDGEGHVSESPPDEEVVERDGASKEEEERRSSSEARMRGVVKRQVAVTRIAKVFKVRSGETHHA